jgi:hypothetical protein
MTSPTDPHPRHAEPSAAAVSIGERAAVFAFASWLTCHKAVSGPYGAGELTALAERYFDSQVWPRFAKSTLVPQSPPVAPEPVPHAFIVLSFFRFSLRCEARHRVMQRFCAACNDCNESLPRSRPVPPSIPFPGDRSLSRIAVAVDCR